MEKELDKDARLFDKPFHVVLLGTGLDILFPKTYNSKIQDVKRKYQQIDGEHYLFVKSPDGYVSMEPPVSNPGYITAVVHTKDMAAKDYFQTYGGMYQDISDELPEDLEVWCKALSVPQTPPGTVTCQLVIEAKKGTLIMSGTAIPKDELDEFMALAEYIKPYDGEVPDESDKEGYKNNTYHPVMNLLEDDDDEETLLEKELEQYEDEDHDDYDDVDDDWQIVVPLDNKEKIRRVLNRLIDNFDELDDCLAFGKKVNGEFEEYEFDDEEVGYGSEIPFFEAAAKFPELHKKIIDFIDLAIDSDGAWLNEEVPKGLNAGYALAMHDQKYIPKYIELLRAVDMDHEVYQIGQIATIIYKWRDYDNALRLMAARCCSAHGQHGFENLDPDLVQDDQRKETFLKFLLHDSMDSYYYMRERQDQLIERIIAPVLDTVEIDYDENKLANAVKFMNEQALPGLDDIV
ncbi:hypothetical protein [Dysgonomonas sp. 25]|uniref:hypothetical protein n=1 Tax=Dysgonomonas sp. 25 TaxID=2302933 RepID=UPI0013D2A1C3|nr:hypothetical protein [Dysgonomonas sp. 25]NDV68956.1 hypothetical protein [Dysgonomonas sp. 25]